MAVDTDIGETHAMIRDWFRGRRAEVSVTNRALAVAFLVGYGVEIFFAFLDSLLVAFGAKRDLVTERR